MAPAKPAVDVSAILASARKNDLRFAMLQAKGGCVLQAHKSKSVDAMRKAAKADGGGAKGAWGTMRLNGKSLVMTCEVAPPGTFLKDAKKFFADAGHTLRIELMEMAEAEADADVAEAGDDEASQRTRGRDEDTSLSRRAERQTPSEDVPNLDDTDAAIADQDEADTEAIADMLPIARKSAINFAWLEGPDGLVFRGHRKRKSDALVKAAKKAGGGPRGASGRMSVSGKVITLVCTEAPPGTFERVARQQLKSDGLQYKIEIQVAGDGDETRASEAPEAAAQSSVSPETGPSLEAVQARYRDVFETLKPVLAAADKTEKASIKKALGAFREALLKSDTAQAGALLDMLAQRVAPQPPDVPDVQPPTSAAPTTPARRIVADAARRDRLIAKTPAHNQAGKALYYEAVEPIELHVRIREVAAAAAEAAR